MNISKRSKAIFEETSGNRFHWRNHISGEAITISFGEWPDVTYITLRGWEADRLLEALQEAVSERNRRQRAVEPGSNTEVSSNA